MIIKHFQVLKLLSPENNYYRLSNGVIFFTKALVFNEIFVIKQSLPEIYKLLKNVA